MNSRPPSARASATSAAVSRTLTLEQLTEGYGLPKGRVEAFTILGVIAADGAGDFVCDDDNRLIIAAAAVQLGFDERELSELMELYEDTAPQNRSLPHFMKLLANYQRFMAWRHHEGPETPASAGFRLSANGAGQGGAAQGEDRT